MKAVNLLPADKRGRAFQPSRSQVAVLAAVALVGGMGYWGYSTHADASSAKSALTAAQAEQTRVDQELQTRRANGSSAATLAAGEAFVAGVASGRPATERLLRRVAIATPKSITYTTIGLDMTPGDPITGTEGGTGLALTGFVPSPLTHIEVARLMTRLRTIRGLGEPVLTSSATELQDGVWGVNFQVAVPVEAAPAIATPTGVVTP